MALVSLKNKRVVTGLLLCSIGTASTGYGQPPANQLVDEPTHRAHVIVGILHYVSWNSTQNSNSPADETIDLCTYGGPVSGKALIELDGAAIHSSRLIIHSEISGNSLKGCDVIVQGDKKKLDLNSNAETIPLTICDGCDPLSTENAIRLVRVVSQKGISIEVHTGFEVDLAMAKQAGVSFGSELMVHATRVEGSLQ